MNTILCGCFFIFLVSIVRSLPLPNAGVDEKSLHTAGNPINVHMLATKAAELGMLLQQYSVSTQDKTSNMNEPKLHQRKSKQFGPTGFGGNGNMCYGNNVGQKLGQTRGIITTALGAVLAALVAALEILV